MFYLLVWILMGLNLLGYLKIVLCFKKEDKSLSLSMTSKNRNPASAKKLDSLTRAVKRNSRVRKEVENSDNEFGIE